MSQERLPMHRVREILRLRFVCALPKREIARTIGIDRETVSSYLDRAEKAGIRWPLPDDLNDAANRASK